MSLRGQVKCQGAMIGTRAAFQEPVCRQTIGDLDRRRLRDPEHPGQPLDRLARIGIQMNQRARVRPAAPERVLHRPAKPIRGGER